MSQALKYSQAKVRMDLLPERSLWEIAQILTYGSRKYTTIKTEELKSYLLTKHGLIVEFGTLEPFGFTVGLTDYSMSDEVIKERMADDLLRELGKKIEALIDIKIDMSQFLVTGDNNWRKGFPWSKLDAATKRHKNLFNRGQDLDDESGFCHLAHAACDAIMELEHYLQGYGTDDRTKDKEYEGQTDKPTTARVPEFKIGPESSGEDGKVTSTPGGLYGMHNPIWNNFRFVP